MNKSKKNYSRKYKKNRKSKKNSSRRHYPKFKRNLARGPSPISPTANVNCCMCDNKIPRNIMLTPLECLQKYNDKAHKICKDCWWDPQIGFARENGPHGCPGCRRKLPLNPPLKSKKPLPEEIIVISD